MRAVRAEQSLRGVHHLLQGLAGVIDLHDAPRDLAECAAPRRRATAQPSACAGPPPGRRARGCRAPTRGRRRTRRRRRAQAIDLHRDVGPIAMQHVQPVLLWLIRLVHHALPVLQHVRQRLGRHDLGEVMTDQLLRRPADEAAQRLRQVREAPSVDVQIRSASCRPGTDSAGRTRSSARTAGHWRWRWPRCRPGSAAARARPGSSRAVLPGDGQRAEDLALGRAQRATAMPRRPIRPATAWSSSVRNARVDQVVVGPDRRALLRREPIHAAADREFLEGEPFARRLVDAAGDDVRPQDRRVRVAQGQVGAIRAEQALGAVHDLLQQLVGVADGGDPRPASAGSAASPPAASARPPAAGWRWRWRRGRRAPAAAGSAPR